MRNEWVKTDKGMVRREIPVCKARRTVRIVRRDCGRRGTVTLRIEERG